MNETLKLGITLLIIAAISAGVLSFVNGMTAPIIAERELQESLAAFFELLPDADNFEELEEDLASEVLEQDGIVEVYRALDAGGDTIGYAIKASAGGYGGQVVTAVAINSVEDTVEGIKVIAHEETPGIGDKIVSDTGFLDSFKEKTTEGSLEAVAAPAAEDQVQAISGSTVSTKAVVNATNKALDAYRNFLK